MDLYFPEEKSLWKTSRFLHYWNEISYKEGMKSEWVREKYFDGVWKRVRKNMEFSHKSLSSNNTI